MAMISCPECGKQISDRAASCPNCGCPISATPVPEAKVNNSEADKMLLLARRARENNDDEAAARYYEQILISEPLNWEAVFYVDYCKAASCVIRDIGPAAQRVKNGFKTAFDIVKNSDMENKNDALYQICDDANRLLQQLSDVAYNHYMQHSSVNGAHAEYKNRVYECGMAACLLGDCFYKIDDKRVAALCYKKAVAFWKGQFSLNEVAINRIKEHEPNYEAPKAGGCYVATAVYGSYDCPQVWTLRRYRDFTLAKSWYGRLFVRTYYAVSPTLVKWFGNTEWFKNMWKPTLDKMVDKLQMQGIENTPYKDLNW